MVVAIIAKQNKRVVVFAERQHRIVPGPKPMLRTSDVTVLVCVYPENFGKTDAFC